MSAGEPCAECLTCQADLVGAIANDQMRAFLSTALLHSAMTLAAELVDGLEEIDPDDLVDPSHPQGQKVAHITAAITVSDILLPEATEGAVELLADLGVIIRRGDS